MRLSPEDSASLARASAFDNEVAEERGRLFAARAILDGGPEKQQQMEDMLGKQYCMLRWPEVYGKGEWKPVIEFVPGLGDPIS